MWTNLSVILLCSVYCLAVQLPNHWLVCDRGPEMNKCLTNAIEIALRDLEKGNKTLGIEPLDPWNIKLFEFTQMTGPLNILFGARSVEMRGYKDVKVERVTTDWEKMDISFTTPKFSAFGDYFMKGSVMYIPIQGNGTFVSQVREFKCNLKLSLERVIKQDEEYFNVKDAEVFIDATQLKITFNNLFNGNKFLENRMNEFINRNWRMLLDLAKSSLSKAFGDSIKDVANGLFSRVPAKIIISENYVKSEK